MLFSLMSVSSLSLLQPENLLKILQLKPLFEDYPILYFDYPDDHLLTMSSGMSLLIFFPFFLSFLNIVCRLQYHRLPLTVAFVSGVSLLYF